MIRYSLVIIDAYCHQRCIRLYGRCSGPHAKPIYSPAPNTTFAAINTNSEDEEGGPKGSAGNACLLLSSATTTENHEYTAKVEEGLEKEERRKRVLELKLAREKAQRHLESLVKKKKDKEDEVMFDLERLSY